MLYLLNDMIDSVVKKKSRGDAPDLSDIRTDDEGAFLDLCKPKLEQLEKIRLAKKKLYEFRKRLAVPAAIVITPVLGYLDWLLLLWQRGSDDNAAGLSFAFLGALYWWVTQPKRQYRDEYKKKILPDLAGLFGNFRYEIDGKISKDEMTPSKILPAHDKYDAEDYFVGTYKGVDLQFCEIDLRQRRRSNKRTYYVTVFKGLAVLLDMKNKKFYGHTILDKDKGKLSEWFKEKSSKLKRANLVDPEFEKVFDVYTNDQVEARYLVDPLMIERLKGLYEEYEGEKMLAAWYDSKMLVLIASKHNHFEPADLHIPASDPQSVLNMKREIGEILSIIDKLSLYDPAEVRRNAGEAA